MLRLLSKHICYRVCSEQNDWRCLILVLIRLLLQPIYNSGSVLDMK